MSLSSELRIIEVAPVYLMPPHSGRRVAPGLTALLERLEIAGMKFIALGQHDGERCSLSTSERVCGYRGANGGTGPIQLIGEYEPDRRAPEGTSTQRLSALTIDVTGSDGFARAVYGLRAADHLARCFAQVGPALDRGLAVRARINVAYGCPYQGNVVERHRKFELRRHPVLRTSGWFTMPVSRADGSRLTDEQSGGSDDNQDVSGEGRVQTRHRPATGTDRRDGALSPAADG